MPGPGDPDDPTPNAEDVKAAGKKNDKLLESDKRGPTPAVANQPDAE